MRVMGFAMAAAMLATPAMAQGNIGMSVGDFAYAHEVLQKRAQTTSMLEGPGSTFGQLSKKNRQWIRDETKRQSATPRPLGEVVADVDARLADDARDISRKHDIDPMDVTRVVTLLIMADAQYAADKDVKKAKRAGDPAALDAAKQRLAEATERLKETGAMQTQVSLALARM